MFLLSFENIFLVQLGHRKVRYSMVKLAMNIDLSIDTVTYKIGFEMIGDA